MDYNEKIALKNELNAVQKAISDQEKLKGILPDESFNLVLNALLQKHRIIEEKLSEFETDQNNTQDKEIVAENKTNESQAIIIAKDTVFSKDTGKVFIKQLTPSDKELKVSYLNRIFDKTGSLHISGVDSKIDYHENNSNINIASVYTAIRTNDMTKNNNNSVINILDKCKFLALLGDPGSGKTTFINFLAWCFAGELLNKSEANLNVLTAPTPDENGKDSNESQIWSHGALIPVIITLRDFTASNLFINTKPSFSILWNYIINELKKAGIDEYEAQFQKELLEKGGIILFDGLDEIPEADNKRELIKKVIEDFVATYHKCRFVVTSRTYAYQNQNWRITGFKESVIAPFSDGQIIRFIDLWYRHITYLRGLDIANAKGLSELLKRAIFNSQRLKELASRPLLLTLMASLHSWRGGTLPEKREELYAETVSLLLDWWERPKIVRDSNGNNIIAQPSLTEWLATDRNEVFRLLCELAYEAHKNQSDHNLTADINENDIIIGLLKISKNPDIRPKRLIEYLSNRAGLLVHRGVGIYSFPHRTFQEYLSACFLTDDEFPDKIAQLFRNDPDRWHEVVLLAGAKASRGSSSSIWALAEELCYSEYNENEVSKKNIVSAILSAELLCESANLKKISERNNLKLRRIIFWLVNLLSSRRISAIERSKCGILLCFLGEPRLDVLSVENIEICFIPEGNFLMGSDKNNNEYEYNKQEFPQHTLELSPFFISRFPITKAQFDIFVSDGGYENSEFWAEAEKATLWNNGRIKGYFDKEYRDRPISYGTPFNYLNHPVVGITFYEALAYTRWLTNRLRKKSIIPENYIVDLPSEAEWEKVSKGGIEIPEVQITVLLNNIKESSGSLNGVKFIHNAEPSRLFPWGNNKNADKGNVKDTKIDTTNTVGCFPSGKSPYGAEEMIGNVWEWTRSLKSDYPYDTNDGREDIDRIKKDTEVIARGGSFYWDQTKVYNSYREWLDPNYSFNDLGFRVIVKKQSAV